MTDYIVTTPKSEMANSAREAANCIRDGGGYYFRRLPPHFRPCAGLKMGWRVFYVEER